MTTPKFIGHKSCKAGRTGSQRNFFWVKAFAVMHRRYLSCTVSRCAELPPAYNSSKTKYPSPIGRPSSEFKPYAKKRRIGSQRLDSFKFDVISNHRLREDAEDVNRRLSSERKPARGREIDKKSYRIAETTSYKLLRDMAFSETVVEGARGDRVLKSMVERAEARAMVMNEPKTSDTPFLGLADEVPQDVSFTPGTFIEARRSVFFFNIYFSLLYSSLNVLLYPETK